MERPIRLLVVEDDRWSRYALASLLARRGCDVRTASSVGEGLDLLDTKPDGIVLDLGLPDGSGEAILRRVREAGLTCRVVVCTVVTDERRLSGLRSMRPNAILTKPVEVDDILDALSA